jgi:glutamyl-tRNA reductase
VNIEVIGINFRSAPLEIREKFQFTPEEQQDFLGFLEQQRAADEWVLLSTCNRTELYLSKDGNGLDSPALEDAMCAYKKLKSAELRKYFYIYRGVEAVRHLFRVACGLDSLVFGEDQILGQVKKAHQTSLTAGSSQAVLNTLFRNAVTGAKLVKSKACFGQKPISAATVAVDKAWEISGEGLAHQTALIIGSGEMSALTVNSLLSRKIGRIYLAARKLTKVRSIVEGRPQVEAVAYERRYEYMDRADLIFSMTASPHYTITCEELTGTLVTAKRRTFIDLAVPRDMDEKISLLPGVRYFNIDTIGGSIREDWQQCALDAMKAEKILDEQLTEFERWYQSRELAPLIRQIEKTVREGVDQKINSALSKVKALEAADKMMIANEMQKVTGFILNRCLYGIKETASGKEAGIYYRCLSRSLSIDALSINALSKNTLNKSLSRGFNPNAEVETDENLCGGNRAGH